MSTGERISPNHRNRSERGGFKDSGFRYPFKVVIKTCGRTTLLRCLRKLLSIACQPERGGGLGLRLEWVGYSRKNYAFPDEQPSPPTVFASSHASFGDGTVK